MDDIAPGASEASKPTLLHVVICTYNRSALLRVALEALSVQTAAADERWAVLVVDNNCTDDTQAVVETFQPSIANLALVSEPKQGLTEARKRGFLATNAPWVAFVDDDCVVAPDWVEHALNFVVRHPEASGFNGRNTLLLESDKDLPWITPQMFAAKDPGGNDECPHPGNLHGAGLVLKRSAVEQSGWLLNASAADRTGTSLISGGDSELSVRSRAVGGPAWFVPQCQLTHTVDKARLGFWYLMRLNYRLAESGPLTIAMTMNDSKDWHRKHQNMLTGGWDRHVLRLLRKANKRAISISSASDSVHSDPLPSVGSVTAEAGYRGKILAVCRGVGLSAGYLKLSLQRKKLDAAIGLAWVPEAVN